MDNTKAYYTFKDELDSLVQSAYTNLSEEDIAKILENKLKDVKEDIENDNTNYR